MSTSNISNPVPAASKKVILRSSDGEEFEVDEAVAKKSHILNDWLEEEGGDSDDNVCPLELAEGKTLAMVVEYCKKHVEYAERIYGYSTNSIAEEELKEWDAQFVKLDQSTLIDVLMAANYLDIKDLFNLCCQTASDMMRGKSPEEIREVFHIKNDYTPEQEEEVRRENAWAFDQ